MEEGGLPFVGSGSRNVKNLVVSVLKEKPNLSAFEIYSQIKSENGVQVTYQGTHKAVGQLFEQGVLSKSGKAYSLDSAWIDKLKDFSDELHVAKQANSFAQLLHMPPESSETVVLDGFFVESFNLLLTATEKLIWSQQDDTPLISHSKNAWAMTVVSNYQYKQLKNITKVKHFILCGGKTLMDEFLLDFWKNQLNAEWRYDPTAAEKCDLVTARDFVVQVFHEPSFAKKWHEAYASIKSKKDIELSNLYKLIFEQKTKTKLVVTRNEALAQQLRQQTLEKFK